MVTKWFVRISFGHFLVFLTVSSKILSPSTLNQHGNPKISISSRKRLPISYSEVPFPCLFSIVYERLCTPIGGKHDLLSTYVEMTWNDHNTISFTYPDDFASMIFWPAWQHGPPGAWEFWEWRRLGSESGLPLRAEKWMEKKAQANVHMTGVSINGVFWRNR